MFRSSLSVVKRINALALSAATKTGARSVASQQGVQGSDAFRGVAVAIATAGVLGYAASVRDPDSAGHSLVGVSAALCETAAAGAPVAPAAPPAAGSSSQKARVPIQTYETSAWSHGREHRKKTGVYDLDLGEEYPNVLPCFIEVAKGSRNKYEWDDAIGFLRLDRVLHSAVFYPHNYGFFPQVLTLLTSAFSFSYFIATHSYTIRLSSRRRSAATATRSMCSCSATSSSPAASWTCARWGT